MDLENVKKRALIQHLRDVEKWGEDELGECSFKWLDDNMVEVEGMEFLVCTDEESSDLWDESLENYIDECILPELPNYVANYFDSEKWKRDAEFDGRGHSLSTYDGNEYEYLVEDDDEKIWMFVYRVN